MSERVALLSGQHGTATGKVELRSTLLEEWGFDPLPSFDPPEIFRDAVDYPLVLTTGGRVMEGFHQNAQQMSAFRARRPEPIATVHPATASAAGIVDGEWMTTETPLGSVRQVARVSDAVHPDAVHADRWWYPERGTDTKDPFGVHATNINVCTDNSPGSFDPIMGSWALRALPCRVSH